MTRPPLSRSSVVTSLASFHGRRRATGVIIVPSLIRDVRAATTARTCHGSTTGGPVPAVGMGQSPRGSPYNASPLGACPQF